MPEASLGAYMGLWLLQQSLVLTSMERRAEPSPVPATPTARHRACSHDFAPTAELIWI